MTSVNYREVKRKAAVGERIKIVKAVTSTGAYAVGDLMRVILRQDSEPYGVWTENTKLFVYDYEYVVLEPVTAAATTLASDPLYAAFRQLIVDNADAIRAILPELASGITAPGLTLDSAGSVKATGVSVSKPTLTRAEVIAKATADVVELLRIGRDIYADIAPESPFHNRCFVAKFHINRDKRTVTALVNRGVVEERVADAKFTAKCSPADVFHAEIGKAIALRKALGLAVPSEYTDAPQPEKAEIGAKVYSATRWGTFTIADGTSIAAQEMSAICYAGLEYCDTHGAPRISDDTDVDYSVAEAKEAA
jgi:hypothetical protein